MKKWWEESFYNVMCGRNTCWYRADPQLHELEKFLLEKNIWHVSVREEGDDAGCYRVRKENFLLVSSLERVYTRTIAFIINEKRLQL